MTVEEIQADLEKFRVQRDQMLAHVNALSGIIQYLEQQLAKEAPKAD